MGHKILECKNLSISFGGLKAIDNLSFDINENEILGLIGPNGAGKTTVFNCITQFYKPDSGSIVYEDSNGSKIELTKEKVHKLVKIGVVRTFQNIELVGELSLLDNILVGAHAFFNSGIFSQALQLPKAIKEEKKYKEEAYKVMDLLGILEHKDEYAMSQPYGIRKKVEIARALMSNPRLLILDEPAAGLNDKESEEMIGIIKDIRDRFNCSILLVEHDMGLIMNLCDRICAIDFGKLLAIGTPDEIKSNKKVREAYLGVTDD